MAGWYEWHLGCVYYTICKLNRYMRDNYSDNLLCLPLMKSSLSPSLSMCCYLHGIIYMKVKLTSVLWIHSLSRRILISSMLFRNCKMESNRTIFKNIFVTFHFKIHSLKYCLMKFHRPCKFMGLWKMTFSQHLQGNGLKSCWQS